MEPYLSVLELSNQSPEHHQDDQEVGAGTRGLSTANVAEQNRTFGEENVISFMLG